MTDRQGTPPAKNPDRRSDDLDPNSHPCEADYWHSHFNSAAVAGSGSLQANVGRTKQGIAVDEAVWKKTIEYLTRLLNINSESQVLELCCGNGMLIGNLAPVCKKASGIDFSHLLIEQLKSEFGNQVETLVADVLDAEYPDNNFDAVLIYFSIQHFDQRQTLQLIQTALGSLRSGGKLLIGDIPDLEKKWAYLDRPEYRKDYFRRLSEGTPKIGNWFQRDFFRSMADYFDGVQIDVLDQPDYQINAQIRFDVVITKD